MAVGLKGDFGQEGSFFGFLNSPENLQVFLATLGHELAGFFVLPLFSAEAILAGAVDPDRIDVQLRLMADHLRQGAKMMNYLLRNSPCQNASWEKTLALALSLFPPIFSERGVKIEVQSAGDCLLRINECGLLVILSNLLKNSGEALPAGGEIQIRSWLEEGWLKILFQDNGRGIPPELLDSFFNLGASSKEGHWGLGMYLIAYEVNRCGGRIECRSAPGGGTVFSIAIPLAEAG